MEEQTTKKVLSVYEAYTIAKSDIYEPQTNKEGYVDFGIAQNQTIISKVQ
jgi:hypothetical protein